MKPGCTGGGGGRAVLLVPDGGGGEGERAVVLLASGGGARRGDEREWRACAGRARAWGGEVASGERRRRRLWASGRWRVK